MNTLTRILTVTCLAAAIPAMSPTVPATAVSKPLIIEEKTADIARAAAWFAGLPQPAPAPLTAAWQLCGGPYNDPCPEPLQPGDVPVKAGEGAIWAMARHHYAGLVMYDQETGQHGKGWSPPPDLAHRLAYTCRAARLQKTDPSMRVIIAPYDNALPMAAEDIQAARCGAYAVSIQTQFASSDPAGKFQPYLKGLITLIRRHSKTILIGFGLSTNGPAGPNKVANLVRDYRYAIADGAQVVWWNIPDWQAQSKCPPADRGCAYIDQQLWTTLGLAS